MNVVDRTGRWTAIAASSLILTLGACTPPTDSEEPSATEPPATESPTEAEDTEPTPSDLQTYDETAQGIPVTAQHPDTMTVTSQGSGEGVGVYFTFAPQGNALDNAEISVFLPANAASTDALMPMITGPNGLIENNEWSLEGSRADTASEFPYPWFEMVFDISTDFEQSGHILIGQSDGQAIQVVVLYPSEMAEQFWPAANTVLDSLEFEPNLLPVENSEASFEGEDPATMCDPATDPC